MRLVYGLGIGLFLGIKMKESIRIRVILLQLAQETNLFQA